MAKVYHIMSGPNASKVELAYLLAKKFHKGQVRRELGADGQPLRYFEHLRRTAIILMNAGYSEPEIIITALLHDSIEDSEEVVLLTALIESLFNNQIADWVKILTKTNKDSYIDNLTTRLMEDPQPDFIAVKAADRLDNLRSLPEDEKFRAKQIRETREHYIPLFQSYASQLPEPKQKLFNKIFLEIKAIAL